MYRSKEQVDKHAKNILTPVKDEKEKRNKGYQIGKLYYEVGEYDTAKRYVGEFLSVKDTYSPAYKLLAQIHEKLQETDKAIASYKRCLELDDKQKDVLLKLCQLYCQTQIDRDRARYWAERLEKVFPNHETVYNLKEKMYLGNANQQELEELITNELTKRPKDVRLRVKLLRLFMDSGRVNEAYTHAVEVERKSPYPQSLEWYQCLRDILQEYSQTSGEKINGAFHRLLLQTHNNLVSLSLEQENATLVEAATALHKFDQTVFMVQQKSFGGDEWRVLLQEMQAQVYYHAATLLLRKAQQEKLKWKEASDLASACYLASVAIKPPNTRAAWFRKASDVDKATYEQWHNVACYRTSQAGHMLDLMCGDSPKKWLSSIQADVCNEQGKSRLFGSLFTQPNMKETREASFLYNDPHFTTFSPELLADDTLRQVDQVACRVRPDSLHHLVWLCLQYYNIKDKTQPDYGWSVFDNLQYGVLNLDSTAAETLCQLDTQAFLYAAVATAALWLEDVRKATLTEPGQPALLPAALAPSLVSPDQQAWWTAAWQLYTNQARENFGSLRLSLQRGLETIRVVTTTSLDLTLLVHLARTFDERTDEAVASSQSVLDYAGNIGCLQALTARYWQAVRDQVGRRQRGQSVVRPGKALFSLPPDGAGASEHEVALFEQEAAFFEARVAMDDGRHEDAIAGFAKCDIADASFYQAQLYKKLACDELGEISLDDTHGDDRDKQIALLTEAKNALYLTLDRMRGDASHKLTEPVAEEIDDVEMRLHRLTAEHVPREASLSSLGAAAPPRTPVTARSGRHGDPGSSFLAASTPTRGTPRRVGGNDSLEVNTSQSTPLMSMSLRGSRGSALRPSPERLEAQMRSLALSQDSVVRALVDELKESRKQIQLLQEKMLELDSRRERELEERRRQEEERRQQMEEEWRRREDQWRKEEERRREEDRRREEERRKEDERRRQEDRQREEERRRDEERRRQEDEKRRQEDEARRREDEERRRRDQAAVTSAAPPVPAGSAACMQQQQQQRAAPGQQPAASAEQLYSAAAGYRYGYPSPAGFPHQDYLGGALPAAPGFPPVAGYPGTSPYTYSHLAAAASSPLSQYGYHQMPGGVLPGYLPPVSGAMLAGSAPGPQVPPQPAANQTPANKTPGMPAASQQQQQQQHQQQQEFDHEDYYVLDGEEEEEEARHTTGYPITASGGFTAQQQQQQQQQRLASAAVAAVQYPAVSAALFGATPTTTMPGPGYFSTPDKESVPFAARLAGVGKTPPSASAAATAQGSDVQSSGGGKIKPRRKSERGDDGSDGEADLNDSYKEPEFEPIVTLPENVELITGEEEEECLYEARAKLFRFMEKQWKERGTGQIKILVSKDQQNLRVVMRRDQIHKVCANHYIRPDMTIDYRPDDKDKKTLTWKALDHSDDEPRIEQFCCKFKAPENASEFKAKFEDAIARSALTTQTQPKDDAGATQPAESSSQPSLGELFRPAAGSWTCDACYVTNGADTTMCAACTTPKPGCEAAAAQKSSASKSNNITLTSGGGFQFGGMSAAGGTGGFGSFGSSPATAASTATTSAPATGFAFGAQPGKPVSGGWGFMSSSPATSTTVTKADSSSAKPVTASITTGAAGSFTFGGQKTAGGFSFGGGQAAVTSSPTPASDALRALLTQKDDDDDDEKTDAPKPTFGGFSFTTTPVVKKDEPKPAEKTAEAPKKKEEKPKEDAAAAADAKPNPFAKFSFGSSSATAAGLKPSASAPSMSNLVTTTTKAPAKQTDALDLTTTPTTTQKTPQHSKSEPKAAPLFGSKDTATFSSLAATTTPGGFTKSDAFKGFGGEGTPVFGAANTTPKASVAEDDDDDRVAEYEPDVDFAPVVELPEVEVKTGEEDETRLFGQRAKLFRLDPETKAWKERGVGEMRILASKDGKGFRVLMRRDQVLKLCANHHLAAGMRLTPLTTADKAWCWTAQDFAEEELRFEQFAAKFKTEDAAASFKKVFDECVAKLSASSEATAAPQADAASSPEKPAEPQMSLAEQFKGKSFGWTCDACYVQNPDNKVRCLACDTLKPGAVDTKTGGDQSAEVSSTTTSQIKINQGGGFTFGGPAFGTSSFGSGSSSTSSASTPKNGVEGGFKFGGSTVSSSSSSTSEKPSTVFGAAICSPSMAAKSDSKPATPGGGVFSFSKGFSFNASGFSQQEKEPEKPAPEPVKPVVAATTPVKADSATPSGGKFSFASGNTGFSFAGVTPSKPKSPGVSMTTVKSPTSPQDDDHYYADEDEGEHIYFEPIVKLPDNVEITTGEEGEECLFCDKAKLFRFGGGEWKERGVGDVKLLRDKATQQVRIVMRRDQVLKICLNHNVSHKLELKPMAGAKGKAWVWHADDFAEGEISHDQLAIKFRSEDAANAFKTAFEDAKDGKGTVVEVRAKTPSKQTPKQQTTPKPTVKSPIQPAHFTPATSTPTTTFKFGETKPDSAKTNLFAKLDASEAASKTPVFGGGQQDGGAFKFGASTFGSSSPFSSSTFGGGAAMATATPQQAFSFAAHGKPADQSAAVSSTTAEASGRSPLSKPTRQASSSSLLVQLLEGPASPTSVTSPAAANATPTIPTNMSGDTGDVVFVREELPSDEFQRLAAQYQLPRTFYNYITKASCKGCIGCDPDSFDFSTIGQKDDDVVYVGEERPTPEQAARAQKFGLPPNFYMYEDRPGCTGCPGCRDDPDAHRRSSSTAAASTTTSSDQPDVKPVVNGSEKAEADSTTSSSGFLFSSSTATSSTSFAALAKSSQDSGFAFGKKSDSGAGGGGFSWQGAGAAVFQASPGGAGGDEEDGDVEQAPDVHFEPIVQLEEVEVRTGEEDETPVFCQRAKLFRYDNNQWKERGIGEMKILKHNDTGKYRLLLRREQIHKLACNHLLAADMMLRPMHTSETAWCWYALDYAEASDADAGTAQQFAVKFKTRDQAEAFQREFLRCQDDLRSLDQQDSAMAVTSVIPDEPPASAAPREETPAAEDGAGAAEEDNDDDYEDVESEEEVLFSKRATLFYIDPHTNQRTQAGLGEIMILEDPDVVGGYRVTMMSDHGDKLCSHIICRGYLQNLVKDEKKKYVQWQAKDFSTDDPIRRTFRAQFSSAVAVVDFVTFFSQGVENAQEFDINEASDVWGLTGEIQYEPVGDATAM